MVRRYQSGNGRRGFTLVEMMAAVAASTIVVFAIGMLIADSQRAWNRMYAKENSNLVADSFGARRAFEAVVRKCSSTKLMMDSSGSAFEAYYYSDGSPVLDLYARFYTSDTGDLVIEYGQLDPRETLEVQKICENVSSCVFENSGRSIQMTLTIDDGSDSVTVVSSAILHNQ